MPGGSCWPRSRLTALVWPVYDALAAQPAVGLGTAGTFAVLSGSAVTNTGPSTLNGQLGVSPGTSVTGFPPGTVNGATHAADAVALQAQSDLTTAYNDAAGRTPALTVPGDLGGLILTPGVYKSASSLGLTGRLTLDAQGNANAVFVFQAGSSLTTASASDIKLIGGAQACNVYWQVGSSATLGTTSVFSGNILAHTSISMDNGVTVHGRALARIGAVTLINDTINPGACTTPTSTLPISTTTTKSGTKPPTKTDQAPDQAPHQAQERHRRPHNRPARRGQHRESLWHQPLRCANVPGRSDRAPHPPRCVLAGRQGDHEPRQSSVPGNRRGTRRDPQPHRSHHLHRRHSPRDPPYEVQSLRRSRSPRLTSCSAADSQRLHRMSLRIDNRARRPRGQSIRGRSIRRRRSAGEGRVYAQAARWELRLPADAQRARRACKREREKLKRARRSATAPCRGAG